MAVGVSTGEKGNFVLSNDGTRLFVAGADGNLRVFDSESGALVATWDIGNQLGGIDISPDGSFMLITEQVPVSEIQNQYWPSNQFTTAVYKVDTATGAVQTFLYQSTGSTYGLADVAITNAGTAVFTGRILPGWSGGTGMVKLDLATGTFSGNTGAYLYTGSSVTASPDGSAVLAGELNLSAANLYTLSATGSQTASATGYANNVYGYASGIEAFSGTGTSGRIAIFSGGSLYLWDGNLKFLANLTVQNPALNGIIGLRFSADGSTLYALSSTTDQILGIRMSDYAVVTSLNVGDYSYSPLAWGDELVLSPDENSFFVHTTTGIVRVDKPISATGTEAADRFDGLSRPDIYSGLAGDDVVYGNGGDDRLDGGAGNDMLAGDAGADILIGGTGDDTYFTDGQDSVVERAGEGNDRLVASASFALAPDAEIETLETISLSATDAINLTGSNSANLILGNHGANVLRGEGGNDVIHGFGGNDYIVGGAGLDVLYGGAGDDRYVIDSAEADLVWEMAGEGRDSVAAFVDYALPDSSEVELLEAGSLAGTTPLRLTGSNTANTIVGNAGGNVLLGLAGDDVLQGLGGNDVLVGGTGADLMEGGAGNDTYYVDNSDDRVVDGLGQGMFDRVATEVSFSLAEDAEIELLEAMNLLGTSVQVLGGSRYANTIVGDYGNNVLRGFGGNDSLQGHSGDDTLIGDEGQDTMAGGIGDDIYFVDAAGDSVIEYSGEGQDRVATSVSYALAAGAEIEVLETTSLSGTSTINLTGSSSANTIVGNNGANWIDGKLGADLLVGAGGADVFAFTSALGQGVDRIEDFTTGTDKIALEDAVFVNLGLGAFRIGANAQDSDDRVIYDSATGALYFDADGNGTSAMVQFAQLSAGLALTGSDFMVI